MKNQISPIADLKTWIGAQKEEAESQAGLFLLGFYLGFFLCLFSTPKQQ